MQTHTPHPLGATTMVALLTLAGCRDDPAPIEPPAIAASTHDHLVWKRAHALEHDLARALELPASALCTELGQLDCIRNVHRSGLGGHDPFGQGLYAPVSEPLVTTPLALDRVVLSACAARVEADREQPVVFTAIDLSQEAPAAGTEAFERTIETLYRRLLSRDPSAAELDVLATLTMTASNERAPAAQFAHLACFAVATTTEFALF